VSDFSIELLLLIAGNTRCSIPFYYCLKSCSGKYGADVENESDSPPFVVTVNLDGKR
jgi:hypothetical protein